MVEEVLHAGLEIYNQINPQIRVGEVIHGCLVAKPGKDPDRFFVGQTYHLLEQAVTLKATGFNVFIVLTHLGTLNKEFFLFNSIVSLPILNQLLPTRRVG